ncbi:RDD family protein [Acidobacteria bacterium ACD]|nr:MAG: RDD family protein [Acidobacteriota bacterium]MCE7959083.1 RDD family protein [Acidobacteria bacterium ACB2]MDL1951558.1 RDD family protein [Acidobacteria bacterium ACD]
MPEPPRDPLAEHPLSPAQPPKGAKRPQTLDLFEGLHGEPGREPAPLEAKAPAPVADEVDEPGEEIPDAEGVAFARRVAAGLADLLILALVGAVELAAGAVLLDLRFPPEALLGLGAFLLLAALVLLVLIPFVWGTTPGMALSDLRVVSAADGGSPTLSAAFLRFLGFLLTGALAGVPLLVAAFDREGRSLSDLMSGTLLVAATPAAAPETGAA